MGVTRNELHANLKVTGEQQFKRALDDSGKAADRAGNSLSDMADDAGFLSKAAAEAKAEIKSLTAALDATGDLSLLKAIKKEQRQLRVFEKLTEELVGPAAQAGQDLGETVGENTMKALGAAVKAGGPVAYASLAVLAVGLVPAIGALIGAAVIGGVGAGGIAGGIAMAAQSSQVKAAGADLAAAVAGAFKDAGEPMVGPTLEAIGVLKAEGVSLAGEFGKAFQTVSPLFTPLAQGLASMVREILPGFTRGLEASKPLLMMLSKELPQIGSALSDMISEISEDPDGAVMALKGLLNLTEDIIITTGKWVGWLERAYESSAEASRAVGGVLEDIFGWMPLWGDYLRDGNADLDDLLKHAHEGSRVFRSLKTETAGLGDAAELTAEQLLEMKTALDDLFGKTMDLDKALIGYEKAMDDMVEILREGNRTLDASTESGRENRGAILDQIEAIKGLYDANLENGRSLEYSNGVYDKQIEQLRATALKLGFNKQQVNELIDAYDRLPRDVELQLTVKGLHGAVAQVNALAQLLGGKAAAAASLSGSYGGGRAGGGPVRAGMTYTVGEKGPERVTFGEDAYVHDAESTAAMGGTTAVVARPVVNISFSPSGNAPMDALIQAMWPFLLRQVRIDGGDLAAFGA